METMQFLHNPYQNIFDNFVSHSGSPNEQFGAHEKLSWGARYYKLDAWVVVLKWLMSLFWAKIFLFVLRCNNDFSFEQKLSLISK